MRVLWGCRWRNRRLQHWRGIAGQKRISKTGNEEYFLVWTVIAVIPKNLNFSRIFLLGTFSAYLAQRFLNEWVKKFWY
jgi:hypothetical protein